MGKKVIQEIRDNYPLYTDLLQIRKSISESIIDISKKKPNNINFLINDNVIVKHKTLSHEIRLIAEVKVRDYKYFTFKVSCKALSNVPFFRYDSDGPSHRNYDENIHLSKQQVDTPHFHNFNSDGISIAYKTKELLKEKTKKALEDISLCVAHFFNEGNIRLNADEFPSISILSRTLRLPLIEEDPNAGVNFL